jgi:hypothetical protein
MNEETEMRRGEKKTTKRFRKEQRSERSITVSVTNIRGYTIMETNNGHILGYKNEIRNRLTLCHNL